jgi:hypothetical protein
MIEKQDETLKGLQGYNGFAIESTPERPLQAGAHLNLVTVLTI